MKNILTKDTIKIKWSSKIRQYYIDKGYIFTKNGDEFEVKIKDLPQCSKFEIEVECDYCHKVFTKKYLDYCKGRKRFDKDACTKCKTIKAYEANYEERKNKVFDKLESICKEKDYELITSRNEFTNTTMNVRYRCKKHGEQDSTIDNIFAGHGCLGCKYEKWSNDARYNQDYVETYINSINNNKLLNKNDYESSHVKNLKILCGVCGKNVFTTSFDSYKNKGINACHECVNCRCSKTELKIHQILVKNGIYYISEKTFPDCRNIRPLMFDFYIPKYNLLIEYDGEGHYLEKFYANRCKDIKSALLETQKRDKIKTDYCIKNNIPLLRIPYWERDNLEVIITNKIQELENNLDRRYSLIS